MSGHRCPTEFKDEAVRQVIELCRSAFLPSGSTP